MGRGRRCRQASRFGCICSSDLRGCYPPRRRCSPFRSTTSRFCEHSTRYGVRQALRCSSPCCRRTAVSRSRTRSLPSRCRAGRSPGGCARQQLAA
jgi:hypothetical protein